MSTHCVLFIEDEAPFRRFAGSYLEEQGFRVLQAGTASEGLELFQQEQPDLVLLDLNLPDLHGVEVLRRIRGQSPTASVVVLTAYGDAANAVTALKAGAADYLTKPIELSTLLEGVRDALAGGQAAAQPAPEPASPERAARRSRVREAVHASPDAMLGEDPAWLACLERVQQAAESDLGMLLLLGESGTGKSHLARLFHGLSTRKTGPFQEVDCPSIPEQLLESELFGHERGAFTGATARRRGMVELAAEGTLFLDEIGELPLSLQPKLLRFLERRRYRRVGGERDMQSEAQVVCATNRDLAAEVHHGTFRRDLFYRLDVISIRLPALNERGRDVILLAKHLIETYAASRGISAPQLSPDAEQALLDHPFPGNVRELKNVVQRSVAFLKGNVIEASDLDLGSQGQSSPPPGPEGTPTPDGLAQPVHLEHVLHAVEGHYVGLALESAKNQRVAGSLLGLDRFALARRRNRRSRIAGLDEALGSTAEWLRSLIGPLPSDLPAQGLDLTARLREVETQAIGHALELCQGNRSHAAALLGMSRSSLIRRIQEP